ncbi:hypothetical protein M0812_20597 [Anaeramoeba flamelloides]|uniref:Uncharacterized protein n=1 Tax=Anaeramoeba flamelloides TaxID=1746091 RepID=A0AAV7YSM2_9EUKA|nr:hypothetical protein M0812_20597 [Anaeramoeba flamelloides]
MGQATILWNYKPLKSLPRWAEATLSRFYFGKELIVQVYLEPKNSITRNQNDEEQEEIKNFLKAGEQPKVKNFTWKSEVDSSSDVGSVYIEDEKTIQIKKKFKLINTLFVTKSEINLNKEKEKESVNKPRTGSIKIPTHLKNEINKNDLQIPKTQLIDHQINKIIQLHNDIILYKEQRIQILKERMHDENLIVQLKMNELKNQLSRRREGQDSETSKIKKLREENQSLHEQFQDISKLIASYLNENENNNQKSETGSNVDEKENKNRSESETESKTKNDSESESESETETENESGSEKKKEKVKGKKKEKGKEKKKEKVKEKEKGNENENENENEHENDIKLKGILLEIKEKIEIKIK